MEKKQSQPRRIIGLDMHPDIFTAALLEGNDAASAVVQKVYDRVSTEQLEGWAGKHLKGTDLVVLEASTNSFETVKRLKKVGIRSSGGRKPKGRTDSQSLLQQR